MSTETELRHRPLSAVDAENLYAHLRDLRSDLVGVIASMVRGADVNDDDLLPHDTALEWARKLKILDTRLGRLAPAGVWQNGELTGGALQVPTAETAQSGR